MNELAPLNYKQVNYLKRTSTAWFNVLEGGKRGGKNVIQVLAFCIALDEHPERIHLISGVSSSSAGLNILDCNGYGMLNYFEGRCHKGKYEDRNCLFVDTLVGEKIVLISGGGKSDSASKIKGNTYGLAYVTEANECNKSFLNEVMDRTLISRERKIFHDLNPMPPDHWYYTETLKYHEKMQEQNSNYGFNYEHFTIYDNMSVSDEKLNKELETYDKSSMWYKRDILGLRVIASGLVYSMFDMNKNVVETIDRPYTSYYVSIDYGTNNPFSAGLWGLYNGVWYRVKEYYYCGRETKYQKTDDEYYSDLKEFIGDLQIEFIIIDPSALSFITLVYRKSEYFVKKANNSVQSGIQNVATALNTGLIKINDCCENVIREFGQYSWSDDRTKDIPVKENDHALDETRYFVATNKLVEMSI